MAATPSMRTAVHTPPTPLHGGRYDTYYTTRKSTRKTTTRTTRATETPPPITDNLSQKPQPLSKKKPSTHRSTTDIQSPPSSTHTSPHKRPKKSGQSKAIRAMDGNDSSRAASLDPFRDPKYNPALQQHSLHLGAHMLPTPVKTPRKKHIGQGAMNTGGRVLFPDRLEDPMPTPRKNRKGQRAVGFSLYSSMEDGDGAAENEISIYTDSKDKVPELDPSDDNPFLDKPSELAPPPEPSKGRNSRKRKSSHGFDGSKEIEEAFDREEGMVYVFRGKKVYRKFPTEEEDPADEEDDEVAAPVTAPDSDAPIPRSLTRSSIKPRLLFPTPAQKAQRSKSDIEDEEAPTDIDDPNPSKLKKPAEKLTPVKATFEPSTPPDTGHLTRSATRKAIKEGSSSPAVVSPVQLDHNKAKGKKVSPFDGWARTKASVGSSSVAGVKGSKKRSAGAMMMNEEEAEEAGGGESDMEVEKGHKRAKASAV